MGIGICVYGFYIVRVDASRGINKVVLLRQFHGAVTAFDIATDIDHILHAVFAGAFYNRFAIFVIISDINMCMSINDHLTWIPWPGS